MVRFLPFSKAIRVVAILTLALGSMPLLAATHVWIGGFSERFAHSANWAGGSPAGDPAADLSFPAGSRLTVVNDIAGLTVRSIAISGTGYSMSGYAVNVASGGQIFDSTIGPNVLSFPLVLSSGLEIVTGPTDYQSQGLTLAGAISGAGGIRVTGGGIVALGGTAANTYGGNTEVRSGFLWLKKNAGITAVPGPLHVYSTGGYYEPASVLSFADEQIADNAAIWVGPDGSLRMGAVETIGPLSVARGSNIQTGVPGSGGITALTGKLILGGNLEITGVSGSVSMSGTFVLPASRTITVSRGYTGSSIEDLTSTIGTAGLTLNAGPANSDGWGAQLDVHGSYSGPTIIQDGAMRVENASSPVTLQGGSVHGTVLSLTATGGKVLAYGYGIGLVSSGGISLNSAVTVVAGVDPWLPRIRASGPIQLGGATLDVQPSVSRVLGNVYTIIANDGASAITGTFQGLPEGALFQDRWRISYHGGDGNDVTLTEAGHVPSSVSVQVTPVPPVAGTTTVIRATIEVAASSLAATGTVTFSKGATTLATSPVSNNAAFAHLSLAGGIHELTIAYSGDAVVLPSQRELVVPVYHRTPTLTSIAPNTIAAGTTTTLTLHGTNFVNGSRVSVGSTSLETTFISATQLQVDYRADWYEGTSQFAVSVTPPQPGGARSNEQTLTVTGAPQPASPLTFMTSAVSAPVTPGAMTAWVSMARRFQTYSSIIEPRSTLLTDSDNDGVVTWEIDKTVPSTGIWVAVDLSARTILSGRPDGTTPRAEAFPQKMFLRDSNGNFSHIIIDVPASSWTFLWVRPGVGAWNRVISDGGGLDADRSHDGTIVFSTAAMLPLGASPAPPAGVAAGDLFVGIDSNAQYWFGDRVDDHLAEATGGGTMAFTANHSVSGPEGAGSVPLTLLRRDGTDGVATVQFTTVAETATADVHYVAQAGTVRFEAGEILKTIDVVLIDDQVYSGGTSLNVLLSQPAGATLSEPSSATVGIVEDDPAPVASLHLSASSVNEGNSGTTAQIPFTIKLQGATRKPAAIRWMREEGYNFAQGWVTFAPGETQKTVFIPVQSNSVPEPDRQILVSLQAEVDATVAPDAASAQLTVVDDDFATVSISDASFDESQGAAFIRLTASRTSQKPITVTYATSNGTATGGSDYTATIATATFNTVSTVHTITIPLTDDALAEGPERFNVTLTNVANALAGRTSAVVMIVDDEAATAPIAFTDDPIVAGATRLRTIHITELRTAVNARRAAAGLPAFAFTDPNLVAGMPVRAIHLTQLRSALDAARAQLGMPAISWTDPVLSAGSKAKAVHIEEIRAGCR